MKKKTLKEKIMRKIEQDRSKAHILDTHTDAKYQVITNGAWGDIPWEFIADSVEPEAKLCTAAFCIVTYESKLVLVKHGSRGYEFAGGHIDPYESADEAVRREVLEESGALVSPQFFGYKKVSPAQPIYHRDQPDTPYPFPHSYIPYYFAEADELLLGTELAADVEGIYLATLAEAYQLLAPDHNHEKIIEFLIEKNLITVE